MRRLLRILLIFLLMTGIAFGQNHFDEYHKKVEFELRVDGCVAGIMSYIRQKRPTRDLKKFCIWAVEHHTYRIEHRTQPKKENRVKSKKIGEQKSPDLI